MEADVRFGFVLAGIIAIALLGYLAYALFHPERFQ
jgi:K+-transporting ATPase KdpF subunit